MHSVIKPNGMSRSKQLKNHYKQKYFQSSATLKYDRQLSAMFNSDKVTNTANTYVVCVLYS